MARALTVKSLEKLKPDPERRREVPDGLLQGLYHIIQPSGARSWAVRYRAAGRPRKLTLGAYPALELSDAREAAGEALRAAARGEDPATAKQLARRAAKAEGAADLQLFGNVARTFLARHAKSKNRSWRETARLLGLVPDRTKPETATDPLEFGAAKGGIADKWVTRHIGEIERGDVIALLDDIVDRGAPIAANRTLAALSKLFSWATERGLIGSSPVTAVRPPAPEVSRDRALSDDEIRWFWKATEQVGYPFGWLAQVLLLTGQRRDEVAGMTAGELDGMKWLIPRDRAKNNHAHVVPLSEKVLATLEAAPRIVGPKSFIFTTTGETPVSGWSRAKNRLDQEMLAAARREAVERGDDPETVSIPRWTLHDLRRTAASGMARLGIAVHVVERLLNHRSGTIRGVAAIYNRHDYWTEREAASEAWGRYVGSLVSGGKSAKNVVPLRTTMKT